MKYLELKIPVSERKLQHPKANQLYLDTAREPWRLVMNTAEWYKNRRNSSPVIDHNRRRECMFTANICTDVDPVLDERLRH